MERIPASERTREKLTAVIEGSGEGGGTSKLVRLAARLIIEEALESEARDALGRDYYARGAAPGAGYRNGYRTGRLKSAEGAIAYSAPQIADRVTPFRSAIREIVRGRTAELEALAVEMYARGLSTRDIEALFADADGHSLLSRTAVSEITERLWAEYEGFAGRELAEFEVVYLFVDGIAERLHLGQPREAVLAAWGLLADGKKALLHLAPGTKEDTASCREFFRDMGRRGLPDPLLVVSDGAPGIIRAIEECFPRALRQRCLAHKMRNLATAGRPVARVQGPRRRLLSGRLAGFGAVAARRHPGDLWPRSAERSGLPRGRFRGLHRASALSAWPSPSDPGYQSAGALVWRGAAAHQSHPPCLRRTRRLEADVCGADPRRRTLARPPHQRVRAPSTQGGPRGHRRRLRRTQCAGDHCAPTAFIQQPADLTRCRDGGHASRPSVFHGDGHHNHQRRCTGRAQAHGYRREGSHHQSLA